MTFANSGAAFFRPLPLYAFNPLNHSRPALRAGSVAEWLLSKLPTPICGLKPAHDIKYVSMVDRANWLLLRESLISLHRAWQAIPQLTIVSDGSWSQNEFSEVFRFWPEPIRILMPEDIINPLADSGQTDLVKLAQQHPHGLKLAAIISLSREQPTLFVDSDILWFSDPDQFLSQLNGTAGPSAGVESGRSYNEELARHFLPDLLNLPGINTGCVYLKGELCAPDLMQQMLAVALENPKHTFNEQTIIALAVHKSGRRLPDLFCMAEFSDAMSWNRRHPWREGYCARHYVHWMRHQFYRDALRLRFAS